MYETILTFHNLLRWVLVISGVLLLVRSAIGLSKKQDWKKNVVNGIRWYTIAFDLELLAGLVLYFGYSPLTQALFQNFQMAIQIPAMRFFGFIHITLMIIALALAHIGRSRVKKALTAVRKYQQTLLWFGISFGVLLLGVPWPFYAAGRPLLRLFGLEV